MDGFWPEAVRESLPAFETGGGADAPGSEATQSYLAFYGLNSRVDRPGMRHRLGFLQVGTGRVATQCFARGGTT